MTAYDNFVMVYKANERDIDAISKFLDDYYRKDYFLPKSRLVRMITGKVEERFGNDRKPMHVFFTSDNKGISGLAIVTLSGTLIQLLVRDDVRDKGIGTRLVEFAEPKKIRCKTDIAYGNPIGFYLKNGYNEYQLTFDNEPAKVGKNSNIVVLERKKGGD